jgi:hypothetical protein
VICAIAVVSLSEGFCNLAEWLQHRGFLRPPLLKLQIAYRTLGLKAVGTSLKAVGTSLHAVNAVIERELKQPPPRARRMLVWNYPRVGATNEVQCGMVLQIVG